MHSRHGHDAEIAMKVTLMDTEQRQSQAQAQTVQRWHQEANMIA